MRGFERAQWVPRDWRASRTIADFTTSPLVPIQRGVLNESGPTQHNELQTSDKRGEARTMSLFIVRAADTRSNQSNVRYTTSDITRSTRSRALDQYQLRARPAEIITSLYGKPEDKIPMEDDTRNIRAKWTIGALVICAN